MQTTFQNFSIPVNYNNNLAAKPPLTSPLNKVKEQPLGIKQKTAAYIGSSVMALGMGKLTTYLYNIFVGHPLHKNFISSGNYTQEEFSIFKDAGEKVLESSGLKEKGVKIKYLADSQANRDELRKLIVQPKKLPLDLQKIPIIKKMLLWKSQKAYDAYIKGTNACYMHSKKTVWINENKIMEAIFHELGHAKSFQAQLRAMTVIKILYRKNITLILLAAILLPKKKKEKLTKSEKFNNAVVNSLPYIVLAGNAPTLVEEARASIYGKEFAKKLLKPELLKKVVKSYKKAYLTYIASVLSIPAIYKVMILTKDESDTELRKYFAEKNKNKQVV